MKKLLLILAASGTLLFPMGCGLTGTDIFNIHKEDMANTSIRLSGNLSVSSAASKSAIPLVKSVVPKADTSKYKLYCVTFEETPNSGSGSASATGAFELSLAGAKNVPFGCFVLDTSDNDSVVATLVFEDSTESGMSGGSQQQGTVSLTGSADLGTIVIDLDAGTATVDMNSIVLTDTDDSAVQDTSKLSADELFDFTGTWVFDRMDGATPAGYTPLSTDCATSDGPCVGFPIYMRRVQAKAYEYTGSSESDTDWLSGTTNQNKNVFGIMVWSSEKAFQTCGSVIGFTNDEAKQYGRVDFTGFVGGSTGLGYVYDASNKFNWTDGPVTGITDSQDNPVTAIYQGWKNDDAVTKWDIQYESTAGELYSDVNRNGRYDEGEWLDDSVVANGRWDPGEWFDDRNGNKMWDQGEIYANGFENDTDNPANAYNDTNGDGIWNPNETPLIPNPTFAGDPWYNYGAWSVIAKDTLCQEIGTVADMDGNPLIANVQELFFRARCYAESFHDLPREDENLCLKDWRFNWRAGTLQEFLGQGDVKPSTRYVFEKFIYSSKTSGTFTNVERHEEGVEFWDSNLNEYYWISCQILNTMEFNIKYINDTTLIGDMKQTKIILPVSEGSDPWCDKDFDHEPFIDLNGDKIKDAGESYIDFDGSGTYTTNTPESYTDSNGNGRYDDGELYDDADLNGKYTYSYQQWLKQQLGAGVTRTMMKFKKQ